MDYFAITIFNIYFAIEHLYPVKISIFENLGCRLFQYWEFMFGEIFQTVVGIVGYEPQYRRQHGDETPQHYLIKK